MEYSLSQHENKRVVALIGIINEDADLLFQRIQSDIANDPVVVIDFAQVQGINSLGVRSWVTFLRNIEEKKEVIFVHCTPDIIMQINMVPSFLVKSTIESFFVKYVCDTCNKEEKKLILKKDLAPKSIPELPKCAESDCGLQTEELEEEYFVFLTR